MSFGYIDRPRVVGEYSVTKDRRVVLETTQKRYLNESLVNMEHCSLDLNDGIETFESWDDVNSDEKLDVLLQWIAMRSQPQRSLKDVCCGADFVFYRGLLAKLITYPSSRADGFQIVAVQYKSVIFLCELNTQQKRNRLAEEHKNSVTPSYYGYKFEQYVTLRDPNGFRDTSEPVNNKEQYSVAFVASIKKAEGRSICSPGKELRLFYTGEVDCFDSNARLIELKTVRDSSSSESDFVPSFWGVKALKWWAQSYLAGVPEVVVGFRAPDGVVNHMKRLEVSELIKKWSALFPAFPAVAFGNVYDNLMKIKETLAKVPELSYYLVNFCDLGSKELPFIRMGRIPPHSGLAFLPDFFLKQYEDW